LFEINTTPNSLFTIIKDQLNDKFKELFYIFISAVEPTETLSLTVSRARGKNTHDNA
jgi:hypothetical protein